MGSIIDRLAGPRVDSPFVFHMGMGRGRLFGNVS